MAPWPALIPQYQDNLTTLGFLNCLVGIWLMPFIGFKPLSCFSLYEWMHLNEITQLCQSVPKEEHPYATMANWKRYFLCNSADACEFEKAQNCWKFNFGRFLDFVFNNLLKWLQIYIQMKVFYLITNYDQEIRLMFGRLRCVCFVMCILNEHLCCGCFMIARGVLNNVKESFPPY